MAKVKQVISAFNEGLKKNDYSEFFRLIDVDEKCLTNRFGDDKKVILHHVCSVDITQLKNKQLMNEEILEKEGIEVINEDEYKEMIGALIERYVENNFDLNIRDSHGNTPLHYAVNSNNIFAVEELLQHQINVDIANKNNQTPLKIAAIKKNRELELKLLNSSANKIESVDIPLGITTKEFQRMRKEQIIQSGPLKKLPTKPSSIDAIESVIYCEDSLLRENLKDALKIYQQNDILNTMFQMMGLCALKGKLSDTDKTTLFRYHEDIMKLKNNAAIDELPFYETALAKIEKQLGKKFKIILTDAQDTSELKVFSAHEPRGLSTRNNSVFVATKGISVNNVIAIIIHESGHFLIDTLFQNHFKPYPINALDMQQLEAKYKRIVNDIKNRLETMPNNFKSDIDFQIFEVINNVFQHYPYASWDAELIVRVLEIIALYPQGAGYLWLQQYVPDLLNFYEVEINPRISQYVEERKGYKYLSDVESEAPLQKRSNIMD